MSGGNPDAPASERRAGSSVTDKLVEHLRLAQSHDLVGPGDIGRHIEHSLVFAEVVVRAIGSQPRQAIDLGSGSGIPGLVMAMLWPDAYLVLIESSSRRKAFLDEAVTRLGIEMRVVVEGSRAEEAGRWPQYRDSSEAVVARSFAKPAVTAECATGYLSPGGFLVVSEPPQENPKSIRWPGPPLRDLGLELVDQIRGPFHFAVLQKIGPSPARFPRRIGLPSKRPLF